MGIEKVKNVVAPIADAVDLSKALNNVETQLKTIQLEKEKIRQQLETQEKLKKIKVGTGKVLSYIETIAIFVFVYMLPIALLFLDALKGTTIGSSLCVFYENNLDGILYIYGVLSLIFLGKTFTKAKEIKTTEMVARQSVGKFLVLFIGTGILSLFLIGYPLLASFIPYISTYASKITWQTAMFLFTIGTLYIGNKLIFVYNKDTLLNAITDLTTEENANKVEQVIETTTETLATQEKPKEEKVNGNNTDNWINS